MNMTVSLQDRALGGDIILDINRYYMYLKRCVVLDCYRLKVYKKRRKRKLFTGRYVTVHSQFQTRHLPLISLLCREGWRTCWFNAAYLVTHPLTYRVCIACSV
jgi:hypothetical protein